MKKIFIPLVFLTLLSHLNAQNYIFEEGQSGFSLAGLYATTESDGASNSTYGIHPMYTLNGKLTFGLSVSFNKIGDSSGTAVTPNLSYVFLKKTSDAGILNVGLSGAYSFQSYDEFNGKVSTIGPILSYQFNLGDSAKLSLLGGYFFGDYSVKQKNSNYSVSTNQNSYGFSANLLLNKFYIEPSISFAKRDSKSATAYGFSLGYVF